MQPCRRIGVVQVAPAFRPVRATPQAVDPRKASADANPNVPPAHWRKSSFPTERPVDRPTTRLGAIGLAYLAQALRQRTQPCPHLLMINGGYPGGKSRTVLSGNPSTCIQLRLEMAPPVLSVEMSCRDDGPSRTEAPTEAIPLTAGGSPVPRPRRDAPRIVPDGATDAVSLPARLDMGGAISCAPTEGRRGIASACWGSDRNRNREMHPLPFPHAPPRAKSVRTTTRYSVLPVGSV